MQNFEREIEICPKLVIGTVVDMVFTYPIAATGLPISPLVVHFSPVHSGPVDIVAMFSDPSPEKLSTARSLETSQPVTVALTSPRPGIVTKT